MATSTSFLSPVTVQRRSKNLRCFKKRVCAGQMAPVLSSKSHALSFQPAPLPLLQCVDAPWEEEEQKEKEKEKEKEFDPVTDENLDEWIKESVSEIVRNIGEAPFLVRIFSRKKGKKVTVERESATPETWPSLKKKWTHQPDGIILVDQLKSNSDSNSNSELDSDFDYSNVDERNSNKTFGVVVQGRGMDCVSCYILNTCRVGSPAGFCTHFCLARAQCFGDPFEFQLRNAWLNGRNSRY